MAKEGKLAQMFIRASINFSEVMQKKKNINLERIKD